VDSGNGALDINAFLAEVVVYAHNQNCSSLSRQIREFCEVISDIDFFCLCQWTRKYIHYFYIQKIP